MMLLIAMYELSSARLARARFNGIPPLTGLRPFLKNFQKKVKMILNGFLKAAIFSCPQKHILCTQKYYFIRNQGYLGKILRYPQKHILCTQPKYCKGIHFRAEKGRSFIRSGGTSRQGRKELSSPPPLVKGEYYPQNARTVSVRMKCWV